MYHVAQAPTVYTPTTGETGPRPVAERLGDAGNALYVPGSIRTMLYSKPEAFFVKQIGHFPDVSTRLMEAHLVKNDEVSCRNALVRVDAALHCTWYCAPDTS